MRPNYLDIGDENMIVYIVERIIKNRVHYDKTLTQVYFEIVYIVEIIGKTFETI